MRARRYRVNAQTACWRHENANPIPRALSLDGFVALAARQDEVMAPCSRAATRKFHQRCGLMRRKNDSRTLVQPLFILTVQERTVGAQIS